MDENESEKNKNSLLKIGDNTKRILKRKSISNVAVESQSLVRVVLQFLVENGFTRSAHCLQEETSISLNSVPSPDVFSKQIMDGDWTSVLQTIGFCELPKTVLFGLYELLVLELLESGNRDAALKFLNNSNVLLAMKSSSSSSATYKRLQILSEKLSLTSETLYGSQSKTKRRKLIADATAPYLTTSPSHRLLDMVGSSLLHDLAVGQLPNSDCRLDLLTGTASAAAADFSKPATVLRCIIESSSAEVNVAAFAPDEMTIAIGDSAGYVELYSSIDGSLRTELSYQSQGQRLAHDFGISALAFSPDAQLISSADDKGTLKIWSVLSGSCKKKIVGVHGSAVSSISFHPEKPIVLTSGLDSDIKLTAIATKATVGTFKSHEGYSRCSIFDADGSRIISGGDDGRIFVSNRKNRELLKLISIPSSTNSASSFGHHLSSCPVHTISLMPSEDMIVVGSRSRYIHLFNLSKSGNSPVKSFESPIPDSEFVATAVSGDGSWLYGLTAVGDLLVFDVRNGTVESEIRKFCDGGRGVVHHQSKNLVAVFNAKSVRILGTE